MPCHSTFDRHLTSPSSHHSVYLLGDSHARRIGQRQRKSFVHVNGIGGATSSDIRLLLSDVNWNLNSSIKHIFIILGSNDIMKNCQVDHLSVFRDILSILRNLFPESRVYIFPVFLTLRISKFAAGKYNLGIHDFIVDNLFTFGIDLEPASFVNNLVSDGVHFKDCVYDFLLEIILNLSRHYHGFQ